MDKLNKFIMMGMLCGGAIIIAPRCLTATEAGDKILDALKAQTVSSATLRQARELAIAGETAERLKVMEFFGGKHAESAKEEILHGLRDTDARVRAKAAFAFRNLKSIPQHDVEQQLKDLWAHDRFTASAISAYRGVITEDIVQELLAKLVEQGPLRYEASNAIYMLGEQAGPFVQKDLLRLLDSDDKPLSCTALHLLAKTRAAPISLVPRMHDWIKDKRDCHHNAAAVLGAIGPAAAPAVPDLAERIQGNVGSCCSWDAEYLVQIGTPSVPILLSMADESDPYRRAWAAYALGQLGDKDQRAGSRAIAALGDPNDEVSFRAQYGLERLGPAVRALACPLFQRMLTFEKLWYLKHSMVWPGELKLFFAALPVDPQNLSQCGIFDTKSDLEVTLDPSTRPFAQKEAINLNLRLKNTGKSPIRIVTPRCSVSLTDPLELIIFEDPGWLILQRRSRWTTKANSPSTDDGSTMILPPGAQESFACILQNIPQEDDERYRFGPRFDYESVGLGKVSAHLTPGQYRIRAHYRLRTLDLSGSSHWSPALEAQYGKLWEGDAYSNEITLEVK